jgi:hypothetical protein
VELFKDPSEALIFAYRYSSQQYAETPMSKLMKKSLHSSGKGLVSLDGAAQAGFVKAEVEKLERELRWCIVLRYANVSVECDCCGGDRMPDVYMEALAQLDDWALQLLNGLSNRKMRRAIIRGFFDRKMKLGPIADKLNIPRRTMLGHKATIWKGLTELDKDARTQIDALLEGMCGEVEA